MPKNPPLLSRKHFLRPTLILSMLALLLLTGTALWTLHASGQAKQSRTTVTSTPDIQPPVWTAGAQTTGSVSPLIFGTNMSLFDDHDLVLNSPAIRTQLQHLHISIIRMPVRDTLSNDTEIRAAQAIKSIGAVPLVILRGAVDKTVLTDDIRIVQDMNNVFGNGTVFYEYGNEEDLLGVNVTGYTSSWNAIVPRLKQLAPHGQFIGPVNFQYNQAYLTTFLQHARPRPDEISWHEYTCEDSAADSVCLSNIDAWTTHIASARKTMQATIGSALPIMITEWNYSANATSHDGKNNDGAFMTTWTSKALNTLAANRVFASMQYSCTNAANPLVTETGPTAQGSTMLQFYQHMIVRRIQPTIIPR